MIIIKKGQTMKKTFLLSSICLSLISTGVSATLFSNGPSKQINTTIEKISVKAITADDGVFIDTDSDEFLLERKEWQQIKAYVESALKLPTTEAAMRSLLKFIPMRLSSHVSKQSWTNTKTSNLVQGIGTQRSTRTLYH